MGEPFHHLLQGDDPMLVKVHAHLTDVGHKRVTTNLAFTCLQAEGYPEYRCECDECGVCEGGVWDM